MKILISHIKLNLENTIIDCKKKKKKLNFYVQSAASEFANPYTRRQVHIPHSFATVPMLLSEKRFFRAQPRITTRKFTAAVLLRGGRTLHTRHWQICTAKFPIKKSIEALKTVKMLNNVKISLVIAVKSKK